MIRTRPGWSLIQPYTEPEQKTSGGIVVPETPLQASPLGLGIITSISSMVVYQKNAGWTFVHEGVSYVIIPDSAIIADVEK